MYTKVNARQPLARKEVLHSEERRDGPRVNGVAAGELDHGCDAKVTAELFKGLLVDQ